MVWFKVDDDLAMHTKVMAAGNPAMGLWVRAGAWCAQQLTDGWIPLSVVRSLGSEAQARRLVSSGLWLVTARDGQEGFLFHEWEARQPTRQDVTEARKDGALRQQRFRDRRSEGYRRNAVTNSNEPGPRNTTPARPDPTRPRENHLGGDSPVSQGAVHGPPLYFDHCPQHQNIAEPGNCGGCADARKANRRLTVVAGPEPRKCLIHLLEHTGICPGCAADEKAAQ